MLKGDTELVVATPCANHVPLANHVLYIAKRESHGMRIVYTDLCWTFVVLSRCPQQIDASAAHTCFFPLQRLTEHRGVRIAYAGLTERMITLLRYCEGVNFKQSLLA